MADILHDFFINAPVNRVFDAVSHPAGLEKWWTKTSSGKPAAGESYQLGFGPEYQWQARVRKYTPGKEFEFEMTKSDSDWDKTHVGFVIEPADSGSQVQFHHTGWPALNEHYRISSYCWAMYLRLLKLNLESGLVVPYEQRLNV